MISRLATLVVIAFVAVALGASPARADEVGLSLDGKHWTDELRTPLFDPDMRWVPGDLETRSLWVRNQGPSGASIQIGVQSADPDGLQVRDDISIQARVAGGGWTDLAGDGAGQELTDDIIGEGDRVRVDIRVGFAATSTNMSEISRLPMRFTVRLTQARPGGGQPDDGGGQPGGDLPDTGTTVQPWLIWLAFGLLGVGYALVTRRRNEESNG